MYVYLAFHHGRPNLALPRGLRPRCYLTASTAPAPPTPNPRTHRRATYSCRTSYRLSRSIIETSMNDSVLHGALPHFSDALPMSSFINLPVLFDDVHAITVQPFPGYDNDGYHSTYILLNIAIDCDFCIAFTNRHQVLWEAWRCSDATLIVPFDQYDNRQLKI
ncbi:unnamed protein product [Miscanthus lutarioriparius]|uniref:Uncharacterized protein n=1 Tax=Miscanthus lutarioriparius TaxID=422564 RepID=A0A811PTG9_9POAL|nr:unnamed protein product [Miscanthus lutarioriparius]